tara:strand:+ start:17539 stop:18183 length:645 start_codon:yes stop_codon:yes gene_type:complete
MKKAYLLLILYFICYTQTGFTQINDRFLSEIEQEVNENSQLEILAHELLDVIGPRLVGTPQMQQAHDWALKKYANWGISAQNEQWGEWRGWERGITHIDMVHPRVQTLKGIQLAWSPSTGKKAITAEVVILPTVSDSDEFNKWLPNVKGKLVMISMREPTGRPDYNWEEFATPESLEKMKKERDLQEIEWSENLQRTGFNRRSLAMALEEAGAS